MKIAHLICGAVLLTVGRTNAAPSRAPGLCAIGEQPLFACPIGNRLVAVCHDGKTATYRYGRPGAPELVLTGGRRAQAGYSGGGESQIRFDKGRFGYVVFDRTIRTGFGSDGRNMPQFSAGLLVLKDGKTISMRSCGGPGDQTIASRAATLLKAGEFVAH